MKFYFVFAFVFLFASANAQNFSPALQSMVDAENAFARHSKEKNTRDAFLLYLTDSTVLFDKSGPAWGKKSWQERTPNTSLLFWQPLLVGISKDGDLGFSTGPWEWAPSREAKPEAYGYFASVWRKFSDGWKLALDIGTPTPGPELNAPTLHSSNPTSPSHKSKKSKESLLDADKRYNNKINKEQVAFVKQSFSPDALILRPGSYPGRYPFKNVPTEPEGFEFIVMGGDVATSNDVGYSFGRVQLKGQKTELNRANFLRVWKIEDGTWKIILDVVAVPDGN